MGFAMRKINTAAVLLCTLAFLAGCGKTAEVVNTETTVSESIASENSTTNASMESAANVPDERDWDRIPTVMIDGVLYQSTGYVSSAIGCGNMDGEITSTVDGAELPTKNDQSNFGTGYAWQRSSEGQVIVVMDDSKIIFRDPAHKFAFDMPEEVLNFNAEVLEVRNGSLLVSVIDAPEMFMLPVTGECEVRTNAEIQKEEVAVGDIVRVWSDGSVEEVYPPIMSNIYRIVKEEQEAPEAMAGMANPWSDHKNLAEAEEAAGFSFGMPETIEGAKPVYYRTMGDSIVEVIYQDADGEEAYRIRKGKGQDDISGDYNTYSVVHDLVVDGIDIDMQGEKDGIHRITFSSGEYAYSFTAGTYVPSEENAETLIAEIIERNEDFRDSEDVHQNADGSWSYRGRTFTHRLFLTGRPKNAQMDSFIVVLANTEDVSFDEMSKKMFSSTYEEQTEDSPAIVNLGVYTADCVVDSTKVVVSVADVNPWGATVSFDQYDNTVEEELLTGEHFSLDRRSGDGWTPVEPIITDYGFNDVGYLIRKGEITRHMYPWVWLYGTLEPGQYRIHVQVLDDETHDASAIFTITDGEYDPSVELGTSKVFSSEERQAAAEMIQQEFAGWNGCELHQLWYTSDDQCNADNVKWMNELAEGQGLEPNFVQCIQFKSNFHSPVEPEGAWEPDKEYMNWEWWLARTDGGEWHLMTWGY